MQSSEALLRRLGELIRSNRVAAGLTQERVGDRAGLSGKYVSEIERGTRDVPLSTLLAVVENGLEMELDVRFSSKAPQRAKLRPALPRPVNELARALADLPPKRRGAALAAVRAVLAIARED